MPEPPVTDLDDAGVHYTALWFNASGLNRALVFRNKLTITGSISLTAAEGSKRLGPPLGNRIALRANESETS